MKLSSKWLKRYQWMLCVILTALFLAHTAGWMKIPTMQRVENILYDLRLRATMLNAIDDRIVILDIDEKSLAHEGHWPWRRDKLAYLLDMVFDYYGAKLVGFDVVFSEADNYKILRSAQIVKDDGIAIPILLGNKEKIQKIIKKT